MDQRRGGVPRGGNGWGRPPGVSHPAHDRSLREAAGNRCCSSQRSRSCPCSWSGRGSGAAGRPSRQRRCQANTVRTNAPSPSSTIGFSRNTGPIRTVEGQPKGMLGVWKPGIPHSYRDSYDVGDIMSELSSTNSNCVSRAFPAAIS
jgi:hypothetical protein